MSHFCLLRDPQQYVAHDWDLLLDRADRERWLELFQNHFAETMKHAATQYGRKSGKQTVAAQEEFFKAIADLRANPHGLANGKLNIMELCRLREGVLRRHGLNDPFGYIKDRENRSAIQLYEPAVRACHAMDAEAKWLHLIKSVFAGNVFDLGALQTMNYANESPDFLEMVENTRPRPWLVDDYDRLAADLTPAPPTKWSKTVVFVDNAGTDFILGVMPLARELALCGTKIVLAANELPSLNDITADETVAVMRQLAEGDEDLAALIAAEMFEVVSTGNDVPLIDLSEVSDELNEAADGAELVVLVGMGRAVESNFDAAFAADALKLALLKDPSVAKRVGGEVYDCVCRYEPLPDRTGEA
ncbi:MAG TPA: ARMT1-like domain-containing protein [Phycisphaerae bacterium]|nr:ARMT1-like domain-containing protein [Phycisphaerae bacterium]